MLITALPVIPFQAEGGDIADKNWKIIIDFGQDAHLLRIVFIDLHDLDATGAKYHDISPCCRTSSPETDSSINIW